MKYETKLIIIILILGTGLISLFAIMFFTPPRAPEVVYEPAKPCSYPPPTKTYKDEWQSCEEARTRLDVNNTDLADKLSLCYQNKPEPVKTDCSKKDEAIGNLLRQIQKQDDEKKDLEDLLKKYRVIF